MTQTRSVSVVDMEGATIDSVQIPDDCMAILYVGSKQQVIVVPTPEVRGRRIAEAVIRSLKRRGTGSP